MKRKNKRKQVAGFAAPARCGVIQTSNSARVESLDLAILATWSIDYDQMWDQMVAAATSSTHSCIMASGVNYDCEQGTAGHTAICAIL